MKVKSTRSKPSKAKNTAPKARSGFEKKVMAFLDSQGAQYEYESEVVYYTVPEKKHRYIPDFKINGWFCEAKGRWLANDRAKIKLVLQQNPGIKLRMLFMRDQPIRKGSKTLYSDVVRKLGIDFEISPKGTVPLRWITG